MSPQEHSILLQALKSLDSAFIDYYNYNHSLKQRFNFEAIGKIILGKRMIAEFLDLREGLNSYLLPGESVIDITDGDNPEDWYNFTNKSTSEILTESEKDFLINKIIPLVQVSGINDGDDACLRCARRMIAEVARYEPLSHFRLLMEKEVQPKYFKID